MYISYTYIAEKWAKSESDYVASIAKAEGYEVIIKRYKPNLKTSVYKYLFIAREAQKQKEARDD